MDTYEITIDHEVGDEADLVRVLGTTYQDEGVVDVTRVAGGDDATVTLRVTGTPPALLTWLLETRELPLDEALVALEGVKQVGAPARRSRYAVPYGGRVIDDHIDDDWIDTLMHGNGIVADADSDLEFYRRDDDEPLGERDV